MEKTFDVDSQKGKIRGYFTENGILSFMGINYAKPPIGELRFSPPIPIDPWKNILDASKPGPIAPQPPSLGDISPGEPLEQNEDNCLSLNIWTPSADDKKRPVLLWIHGGALETGSGPDYNGEIFAKRGNIVVVSINYRLGILGFLYIPGKTANVGLLDQILALKWVKNNIERFGGDPENVTISGESAGGLSISCLMTMSSAKGLFKRAIIESNVANSYCHTSAGGEKLMNKLFSILGVEYGNLEALRKIPAEKLVKAYAQAKMGENFSEIYPPYVDGVILPIHPIEAIRAGVAKEIEVLAGTNEDESKIYILFNQNHDKVDEEQLNKGFKLFLNSLGQNDETVKKFIEVYKNEDNGRNREKPIELMDAFITDNFWRIPVTRFVEEQSNFQPKTYLYKFNWKSPAYGGNFGAGHVLELAFVWGFMGEVERGIFPKRTEETTILSNQMIDCWINFTRSGNPNHEGCPKWPTYSKQNRATMIFDKISKVVVDPKPDTRIIWDGII